jgi:hypothetical protein
MVMQAIGSLIETVLWVGLIGAVVWRFSAHIDGIVGSINERIKQGAEVRAAGVTLGAVTPQSADQQRKRLDDEVAEVANEGTDPATQDQTAGDAEGLRLDYLAAEDFALRRIQAVYGAPITRQLSAAGLAFDGMFVKNGTPHIVEVKYTKYGYSVALLHRNVDRILFHSESLGWSRIKIIFVVVYGGGQSDLESERIRLSSAAAKFGDLVSVHCYRLMDLAKDLGVDAPHA